MKIEVEKLTDKLIKECDSILDENYRETGHFIEDLDVHWKSYLMLGDSFLPIVMRDKEDIIRGVLFFLVSPYSHITSLIVAQQITFFVNKRYRFYSIKMITFSEKLFESMNVDFIIQSARYHTKFCDILGRLGYAPSDLTFIKRIS